MPTSTPNTFIDLYGSEIKHAYQRNGAKLRGLVRTVSGFGGSTYRFPRLGAGVANTKARHADVVPMNLQHNFVTATLADYYAPEYVDKLDEFKSNLSVRADYAKSAAMALGRQEDQIIIDAWTLSPDAPAGVAATLSTAEVHQLREHFDEIDAPQEGRFLVISPIALTTLLTMGTQEFIDADFRGAAGPASLAAGRPVGKWLGFDVHVHSGLPLSGTTRTCFAGSNMASGLAIGEDITAELNYVPQKVSNLVNAHMSMGAVLIEDDTNGAGVVRYLVTE